MRKGTSLIAVILAVVWIFGCSSTPGARNPSPATATTADATPAGAGSQAIDICETLMFPPPPPTRPPAIKPAGESVRVLAFGDYGDGGSRQKAVADAIAENHKKKRFDFGITLGDNFYQTGLPTPTDPRWASNWEGMYGGLGIRLYVSLGNHDYYNPASPIAEAIYSQRSKSWCFPASYYTYTAGPVQFFVLDTDWIMREWREDRDRDPVKLQRDWLKAQLDASKSTWKVVYGHHPAYSAGQHKNNKPILETILPVLRNRADVYIAGHDHDMQYLKPDGGVEFFVSGAGGHDLRPLSDQRERLVWGVGDTAGFSALEADASSLTVSFFDTKQTELCTVRLIQGKPAQVVKGCKKES
ncbi:MAG TPA: metallophosphoesterase [Thermoanaerobaculia bacterium]|jgi:hypothetical protein